MEWQARPVGKRPVRPGEILSFDGATEYDGDFSNKKVRILGAEGSRFIRCKFENTEAKNAQLGGGRIQSEYIECSFDGSKLPLFAGRARFERCTFRNADLSGWMCFAVEVVDCVFSGTIRDSFFNGTVPPGDRDIGRIKNEFHGNDFTHAQLIGVSFRTGIDLKAQLLPSGPEYLYLTDAPSTIRHLRAVVEEWKDAEKRTFANARLNVFENAVEGGQQQLLLRPADYPIRRPGHAELLELLKTAASIR